MGALFQGEIVDFVVVDHNAEALTALQQRYYFLPAGFASSTPSTHGNAGLLRDRLDAAVAALQPAEVEPSISLECLKALCFDVVSSAALDTAEDGSRCFRLAQSPAHTLTTCHHD